MAKELLFSITKKDLEITFFSGKGAGGQHRNKHQNCVRIIHKDSGVWVTGTEQRSRQQNIKTAFQRLVNHPNFKVWLKIKASSDSFENKQIEQKVNDWMKPENLKIEYF